MAFNDIKGLQIAIEEAKLGKYNSVSIFTKLTINIRSIVKRESFFLVFFDY